MISLQILWATILVNNLLTSAAVAKVYALYLSVLYFVVFLKFYLVLDLSSFFFSSATKWKNCAVVPRGHWALNTMTTNCDPVRVKVFTCLSRVILMMIDVVMHGQVRVT